MCTVYLFVWGGKFGAGGCNCGYETLKNDNFNSFLASLSAPSSTPPSQEESVSSWIETCRYADRKQQGDSP